MSKKKPPITITHPELLQEWDYEKNNLGPENYTYGSGKKVWWKCSKEHSWKASIVKRTKAERGCPYCANQKILTGHNDLGTTHPELVKQWNYKKNENGPENYAAGSSKKVWWECNKGHVYEEIIRNKVMSKFYCRKCAGKDVITGENDLAALYPKLLEEWDYDKNTLDPTKTISKSGKMVWWICSKNQLHTWKTRVIERSKLGRGCPYCTSQKILPGYNDFPTTDPDFIKEWNYEKNKIGPENYARASSKKVWWVCEKKHEWKAVISSRIIGNNNCPYCSGRFPIPGETDLATTHPNFLKEWNYEKNTVLPREIKAGTVKKYWWKCEKGHEWEECPNNRKREKTLSGCKICNRRRSKGEKELFDYIKTIVKEKEVVGNDRKILKGKEIDIYIPELKIAFEYNGTYWHSNERIFKRYGISADEYHQKKTNDCKEKEVELHHISEMDWENNKKQVKQKIRMLLEN